MGTWGSTNAPAAASRAIILIQIMEGTMNDDTDDDTGDDTDDDTNDDTGDVTNFDNDEGLAFYKTARREDAAYDAIGGKEVIHDNT